ncbi:hypothetical protein PAXRUDRAFT_830286 [Paxillus rubicundulus Ve08.2h10]|uniref:Uncharacterized protein n=1 Tax=Paxillus rubicundulus Ve08.2h10 TaxID=930991 RepID=A0A0D0DLD1_9AGAM|nr:hypothetical protein PAXRUDRAFT_830286 [Paxillus rubicundulus Ve08.2h10]
MSRVNGVRKTGCLRTSVNTPNSLPPPPQQPPLHTTTCLRHEARHRPIIQNDHTATYLNSCSSRLLESDSESTSDVLASSSTLHTELSNKSWH